ncbi:MAG: hypothetical protein FJX42_05840, partial [Alphaproteobacteria bacterium]|nr:hypothetical protein [Alphaproteobacteria bacterium]
QFYKIDAEGHTDDAPIKTERFPSNWELSGGRASTVVRYFLENGMDPDRLKVSAFADTKPKALNRDAAGAAIPANQALNRRVTLEITPMNKDEKKLAEMKLATKAQAAPRAGATLPGAEQPGDRPAQPGAPTN